MKTRKLKTIAEYINNNMNMKGYSAFLEKSYTNTDRKAGRLRIPGKGRSGYKLTVGFYGKIIFTHDSSQTYRSNKEVENWLAAEEQKIAFKQVDSILLESPSTENIVDILSNVFGENL